MHDDNIFHNAKYSSITEGAVKGLLNDMGYFMRDDGKWEHDKSKEVLTDEEAQKKAAAVHSRRNKANPYQKARERSAKNDPEKRLSMKRAERRREQKDEAFGLFPKDTDRLLREHIRAEYEARGIYPTAREVQETYNHVVSILNERNQDNKEASRVAEIKSGRKVLGRNWASEEDAISAARNTKAGLVNPPMPRGGTRGSVANDATGIRRSNHIAKRGIRNISPSSPARQQSDEEIRTRKSGIKSTHVIDMMNNLRKTNR